MHSRRSSPVDLGLAIALALLTSGALLLSLWGAVVAVAQPGAWQEFAADPRWPKALALTLWVGALATAGALALGMVALSVFFPGRDVPRLLRWLAQMLAVPHAAFAIGLAFLLAPSGWLLRLVSPWLSGWNEPPALATVQDPWGLGMVLVLVLKEAPFLMWAAAGELQRADTAQRLTRQLDIARSMGYARNTAWWRLVAPQLLARLWWPVLAVLAYNLSVVDVSLIIGPASPPTLAVLAWQWLQDADVLVQGQGAVASWVLAALLGGVVTLAYLVGHTPILRRFYARWLGGGLPHATAWGVPHGRGVLAALVLVYLAVMLGLVVGSFSGVWAFPALLPQAWTWGAWQSVWDSSAAVWRTGSLAGVCASVAVAASVLWLECAPPRWDLVLRPLAYVPLVLPGVLWVTGLHYWALQASLADQWLGVAIGHIFVVLPYVLITLSPAYQGFDPRLRSATASMGRSRWQFLWRVKWPMLRGALWSAWAVGVAVSVAQYLPTVYLGGGRVSTITTEAVALASGAQRSQTAAFAALQWLLPVLAFSLAARLGRARRFGA